MLGLNTSNDIDDIFDGEHIILREYYVLTEENNSSPINSDSFSIKYNTFICTNEVFNLIYNAGKEILSFIHKETHLQYTKTNKESIDNLLSRIFITTKNKHTISETYNNWIRENGYPYIKDFERKIGDSFFYFVNDCIRLYIVYELHKWIYKLNNRHEGYNSKKNIVTYPTNRFEFLLSLIKEELVSTLYENDSISINGDTISNVECADYLNYTELSEDNKEEYFKYVQKALIVYISSIVNNPFLREVFLITKQFPIYNGIQYRIFNTANSLIGIAYNELLFHLTSGKFSYKRRICAAPECTNEFERIGKGKYCDTCKHDKIPKKLKDRTYDNTTRKKKRASKTNS